MKPGKSSVWKTEAAYIGASGKRCASGAASLVLAAAITSGCASVPPDAGFDSVAQTISQRTGQTAQWRPGEPSQELLADIDALLAKPLQVREALRIAFALNPRLQASYEELGVAQGELIEAGLLPNPVLDAGVFFPLEGGSARIDLGLSQNILSLLFRPARLRVARAELEAAKPRIAAAAISLAANVRQAFYRVQADLQLGEMLDEVVQVAAASSEAAQALFEAGNSTALDRDSERILLEEVKLAHLAAEGRLAEDRERLIRLMGLWGRRTQVQIEPRLPEIPEVPHALPDIEARAIAANLDLLALRREMEAGTAGLNLARAGRFLPTFETGLGAERDDGVWDLGPAISVPVPIFSRGQGRIRSGYAQLRRLHQEYLAEAIETRSAARGARMRLHQSHAAARHIQQVLLPLRDAVVRETQLQSNAGQIGVFQLLQSQRELIGTGRRYIETLYQFWLARTQADALLNGRAVELGASEDGAMRSSGDARPSPLGDD